MNFWENKSSKKLKLRTKKDKNRRYKEERGKNKMVNAEAPLLNLNIEARPGYKFM